MKKGLYLICGIKAVALSAFLCLGCLSVPVLFSAFKTVSVNSVTSDRPVIIIDAGHGGEDGGTQSADGTLEKDINLSISQKLGGLLKADGFKVITVRDDDRMIYDEGADTVRSRKSSDLHNRMKIMKENPGCIFISVHQNHYSESKYSGAQVFYRPNDDSSRSLADSIQKSIVSSLQNDNTRQIKQCTSSVYLIYNASSTAVMVECGFLSNKGEAEKLKKDSYQADMAIAIADGIKAYLTNEEVNYNGK